ncbi:hypothetical protein HDU85_001938 [Gaertneriomyces sp. JEL0708]|nr:hypothetical protein HDU85_001938 [Gaertneriomyces sp. JEL0708]
MFVHCQKKSRLRNQLVHQDWTAKLSDEVLMYILSYLTYQELGLKVSRLSRKFKRLASDEYLWKRLYMVRFLLPTVIPPVLSDRATDIITALSNSNNVHKSHTNSRVTAIPTKWRAMYVLQHRWQAGDCRISSICVQPCLSIMQGSRGSQNQIPAVAFSDRHILTSAGSCAEDSDIFVWKMDNQELEGFITLGQNDIGASVTALHFSEDDSEPGTRTLVAGYSNGSIGVWRFCAVAGNAGRTWTATELCCARRSNGSPSILAIAVLDNVIATCSSEFDLNIHTLRTPNGDVGTRCVREQTLRGVISYDTPVDLGIRKDKNGDYVLHLAYGIPCLSRTWDLGVQEVVFRIGSGVTRTNHYYPVSGIYDLQTPVSTTLTSMRFRPPYLVTAHADNTVHVFALMERARETTRYSSDTTILVHCSTLYLAAAVTALEIDVETRKLVTGDIDGINVWDLTSPGSPHPPVVLADRPLVTLHDHSAVEKQYANCAPRWLSFDEGRIVSVVSRCTDISDTSANSVGGVVRIFSFVES